MNRLSLIVEDCREEANECKKNNKNNSKRNNEYMEPIIAGN
jgi:hypothetical protein